MRYLIEIGPDDSDSDVEARDDDPGPDDSGPQQDDKGGKGRNGEAFPGDREGHQETRSPGAHDGICTASVVRTAK